MTPLPGAVQSTGLILATVLAAAGLNLGVMSLGQADGDGTDVDTAAASTDAGLQALNDTAPAAVDPSTISTVALTDPTATDPALAGSTLPAGTGATPGPPLAAGTSAAGAPAAPGTAAPDTATASTAGAAATSQQTTVSARPTSSQAPSTAAPAPVTTARPTTASTAQPTAPTTARPTTSTTRAPQTANFDHTVSGAGALTVSVTDGNRLGLVSVSDNSGWSHTVDTNRADLVKVVFTRRGSEIAVSVTVRNGVPNFTEERSNDD